MGAVMLSRTPAALRASAGSVAIVLTAVCSPLALTAAGAALAHAGARPVIVVALVEQTFAVALFAAAALRERTRLRPLPAYNAFRIAILVVSVARWPRASYADAVSW